MKQQVSSQYNFFKGALWGAVLGDVIGAHLQFDKDITPKKINDAFKIIGGGKHNLEPGQPTDDSELNFSIIKGLMRAKGKLNLNSIAEQMGNWYLSKPIDIGNTIRNSVPKACNMKVHQAHLCRKGARQCSQTSQSNGTLMALIGLAIWCRKLSSSDVRKAIRQFTILIHPNLLVVLSNTFYTLLVQYLLNNPQQKDKAMKAFQYAKAQVFEPLYSNAQFVKWITTMEVSFTNPSILQEQAPINKASGWVRVALSYAVHHLITSKSFKESIQTIISAKGDTDTNACIMGGLLGAYYGYNELHLQQQIEKISNWTSKNKRRPDWLIPGKVISKFIEFFQQIGPKELIIIGGEGQYPIVAKK